MKFSVELNDRNFTVEAESLVEAVLKIIDAGFSETDNTEFQVPNLINSNCRVSISKHVA